MTLTTVTALQICFGLKNMNELTLLSYFISSLPLFMMNRSCASPSTNLSLSAVTVCNKGFVETEEEQLSKQDDCIALHWSGAGYTAAGRRNDWIDRIDRHGWLQIIVIVLLPCWATKKYL